MDWLQGLSDSLENNGHKKAFCIQDTFWTYHDLKTRINSIYYQILHLGFNNRKQTIAVLCEDSIELYAAIFAIWASGNSYTPLGFDNPVKRNISILKESDIKLVLGHKHSLTKRSEFDQILKLEIDKISNEIAENQIRFENIDSNDEAYILFTSGSTGTPKGVPIRFRQLSCFLKNFSHSPFIINEDDRCLQMFELTFDVSISSFLPALLTGASIFTVPQGVIKYTYVLNTIRKYNLTILQIVPSIVRLGSSLLNRMTLPSVQFCILTGEATETSLLDSLFEAMPNAKVFNYYGPTEATIYCSYYEISRKAPKNYNDMLCIGIPFGGMTFKITKKDGIEVKKGEQGELLISGCQVTGGYLNNVAKNKSSFLKLENMEFYKTGDLAYVDESGHYYYCGRLDNQVQIQGFRVELNEIESVVRKEFLVNSVVIPKKNNNELLKLFLIMENVDDDLSDKDVFDRLRTVLPSYMIPFKILREKKFPLTSSGKTDRKKLKEKLVQE